MAGEDIKKLLVKLVLGGEDIKSGFRDFRKDVKVAATEDKAILDQHAAKIRENFKLVQGGLIVEKEHTTEKEKQKIQGAGIVDLDQKEIDKIKEKIVQQQR